MELLKQLLTAQIHQRLIDEGIDRILICIDKLSDHEIWKTPNENIPSIGNLILHLDGNIRQWLIKEVSNTEFDRDRDAEFDKSNVISRPDIHSLLEELRADILKISLERITLSDPVQIQGFDETYLGVIVHVIEHFSYHTGQITLLTKLYRNIDVGYYEDLDL